MKSRLLLVVCISIHTLASSVCADPVTLDFTGVITRNYDLKNTSNDPYGVGTSFSGYVTYDADNIEWTDVGDTNPGNNYGQGGSNSGCVHFIDGVCTSDRGSDAPVITDYHFEWIGGVVSPWVYSLDFSDNSRRTNNFDVAPAPVPLERWAVIRNQFVHNTEGDVTNTDITVTTTKRAFTFVRVISK